MTDRTWGVRRWQSRSSSESSPYLNETMASFIIHSSWVDRFWNSAELLRAKETRERQVDQLVTFFIRCGCSPTNFTDKDRNCFFPTQPQKMGWKSQSTIEKMPSHYGSLIPNPWRGSVSQNRDRIVSTAQRWAPPCVSTKIPRHFFGFPSSAIFIVH